jgi:hypothetical protein
LFLTKINARNPRANMLGQRFNVETVCGHIILPHMFLLFIKGKGSGKDVSTAIRVYVLLLSGPFPCGAGLPQAIIGLRPPD